MEKWPSNSGTNVNNECGVKESRQERERKPARPISSAHATTHCTTHVLSTPWIPCSLRMYPIVCGANRATFLGAHADQQVTLIRRCPRSVGVALKWEKRQAKAFPRADNKQRYCVPAATIAIS